MFDHEVSQAQQYKHAKQKKYHVRNWAEYNEGLRRRGDLTVWFDDRREWYKLSGCTERSMVENAVYRYKAIIGPEMRTRTLARQRVEHRIGCEILNKMTGLGMPDIYCAG